MQILEGEQSSSSDSKRLKLTLDLFAHNSSGKQEIKPEVEKPESSTEKLSSQEILNKLEEAIFQFYSFYFLYFLLNFRKTPTLRKANLSAKLPSLK